MDMRSLVNFCDFFVIATATSDRQAKAVAEAVVDGLKQKGVDVEYKRNFKTSTGLHYSQENGAWIILDMGDVVCHIFEPQSREFYALEHLWQDALRNEYKPRGKKKL